MVQSRVMNHRGYVPWLLWVRPTNVGERAWLLMRPGICAEDLESRTALAVFSYSDTKVSYFCQCRCVSNTLSKVVCCRDAIRLSRILDAVAVVVMGSSP